VTFLISKTFIINSGKISKITRILEEIELAKNWGVLSGMQRFQLAIVKIMKRFSNE
jgi:hypothetical protein